MNTAAWDRVRAELDRAAAADRTIGVWLRDDDAVAVTPALERLEALCAAVRMPVLLAVIPALAEAALGSWIAGRADFTPCQHGYDHGNHAAAGQRACELGADRPDGVVAEDLGRGRRALQDLFGARLSGILVPPWNRIDPDLIGRLPGLGFTALSTFGPPPEDDLGIRRINADLDIVDWRAGRIGRSFADVAGKLAPLVAAASASGRPIGLLTHHLAHDAQAWAVLQAMLARLGTHPAVVFTRAA